MDAEQFDVVWCGAGGTGGAGGAGGAVAQRRLVRALVREGAALEQAACRACLQEAGPAGLVRLDSQIQLLDNDCAGVYFLKDMLSYITRTKVEMDGVLPCGLCEKCLQDCGTAFAFMKTCESNMKALENIVDYISCCVNMKAEDGEPAIYLKILPHLYDYSRFDKDHYVQNIHVRNNELKEINKIKKPKNENMHPHKCGICNNTFTSEKFLLRHKRDKCHNSNKYDCQFCDFSYIYMRNLERHIIHKHPREKYQATLPNNFKTEKEYTLQRTKLDKMSLLRHKIDKREANYKCQFCGFSYTYKRSLVRHISQKHSYEKYHEIYKNINKNTKNIQNVQNVNVADNMRQKNVLCKVKNLKTGTVYILHVCTICNKKFTDEPSLLRHKLKECIKICHDCQFCGFSCLRKNTLKVHIKEKHYHEKYQPSSQTKDKLSGAHLNNSKHNINGKEERADNTAPNVNESHKHVTANNIKHTKAAPIKGGYKYSKYCKDCFKHFTCKKQLREHRRTHEEEFYQCAHCSYTKRNRRIFIEHMKMEHGNNEKIASETQTKRRNLKIVDVFYECGFCGHLCANKLFTIKHIENHTCKNPIQINVIYKPKVFKCKHCGLTERKLKLFNDHIRRHVSRFTCEFCGKTYRIKSSLDTHRLGHLPGNLKGCDICGKQFRSKEGLMFHKRRHTGEKPYKCGLCSDSFVSPSLRGNHIKLKHYPLSTIRHRCDICNKTFSTVNIMRRHVRVVHMRKGPLKKNEENDKNMLN